MRQIYQDLKVWQKGMDLVKQVYKETRSFPKEEIYGLTSQLRRAVVSVPVNIAEGRGRVSRKEYSQFLSIARGSLYEILTLLEIAQDLGYVQRDQAEILIGQAKEITAMLNGLMDHLR